MNLRPSVRKAKHSLGRHIRGFSQGQNPQVSALDSLPAEVLEQIFNVALPFEISKERNGAVLRLCSVSSRWRRIARQFPLLWASLRIMVPNTTEPKQKSDRKLADFWRLVDAWIQRSGDLPLYLALADSPGCDYDWLVCFVCRQLYSNVFQKYLPRIRSLEGVTRHLFRSLCEYPMISLESLVFDLIPGKAGIKTWLSLSEFAPNLRQLSLHDIQGQPYSIASVPPLSNLTHLSTRLYGYMAWVECLQLCPRLQSAVLYYLKLRRTLQDPVTEGMVSLPDLISLTVIYPNDDRIELDIFYCLDMPSLTTLRLGSFHLANFHIQGRPPPIFEHLRSVRHFSLIFAYLSRPEFIEFILQLPNLEVLDIQDCLDFRNLVSNLRKAQEDYSYVPFLPRLRTIILDVRQPVQIDFSALRADLAGFLDERQKNEGWEDSLHIKFYFSGPALKVYPSFRTGMEFKQQGLSHQLVFWDQEFGRTGSRWKYRLGGEEDRWIEGI